MKKTLAIALVLIFTLCVPTFAGDSLELPDGTSCDYLFDAYNEYGGVDGIYFCTATDGYEYIGFGPPQSDPAEW